MTTALRPDAAAPATRASRMDLYVFIHKALRRFMSRTLDRLGTMDVDDEADREQTLAIAQSLLSMLKGHLQHENDFIHTAIEARRPGAARHTADDHALHLDSIANLEDEVRAVRDADGSVRTALALRLYRHFGLFVGENLVHMQLEETQNNALLWDLYRDDELATLHDRLVASLPPGELLLCAYWFAAALSPQETAIVFGAMQAKAPAPAFDALLEAARPALDESRWARLCRALGRPPVPGLVTA
jgi:hypothetical protein